ncbi:MAG: hypothetical protein V4660_00400 [Pseudomonadota bacterium]
MKLKSILIVVVIFFLQACAVGQKRTLLKQADRENIKSLELYNLIIQDEVRPAVELSNVAGAGLAFGALGALITASVDSSINKGRSLTSQDLIEPLYNATDEIDYRKILAQEVNASVSSIYTLKTKKDLAESLLLSDPALKTKLAGLADGEYLLALSSFYGFMENSKTLNFETAAMIFKKRSGDAKKSVPQPIYFNRFNYISKSVGNGAISSIAEWSNNNGELFKSMLNESAKEISHQLKYDLQNTVNLECGKSVQVNVFGFNGVKIKTKAVLISENNARAVVRSRNDGFLYSVPEFTSIKQDSKSNCQ